MAEVLVEFEASLPGPRGRAYVPRVCGRPMADTPRWEAWIEFVPDDESPVLRTPRETVQPNRQDVLYWATGLTTAYLEGALARALAPPPAVAARPAGAAPAYEAPAPESVHVAESASHPPRRAVLDPFRVYAQGEDVLRRELGALDALHLRTIVRAYRLGGDDEPALPAMDRSALVERIVAAVRARSEPPR